MRKKISETLKWLSTLSLLSFNIACYAQTSITIKQLKQGDTVPDMALGRAVNAKYTSLRFSDLRGKLVILDFWATWCVPCVRDLPKLDSLQQQFGDKIAIIPVDGGEEGGNFERALAYLQKKGLKLPSIIDQQHVIDQMFPHQTIPYEVWIDKNGKVIATTTEEEVTEKTIRQYLSGSVLNVAQVHEQQIHTDKPLFVDGNGGAGDNFYYRSIFTPGEKNWRGGGSARDILTTTDGKVMVKSANFVNMDLINIFYHALAGNEGTLAVPNPQRLFIETPDSTFQPFDYYNNEKKWRNGSYGKLYCFNLTLKKPVEDVMFYGNYMLSDLNRAQDQYHGRFEKKIMPCLILVRIKGGVSPIAKTGDSAPSIDHIWNGPERQYFESVQNFNFRGFVKFFLSTWYYAVPPIFDETGLGDDRVTITDLHLKYMQDDACHRQVDIDEWRKAFNRYGIGIKVENREVNVLVLTELSEKKYSFSQSSIMEILKNDDEVALGKLIGTENVNTCFGEYSMLSHAVRFGSKRCFDLLLEKGANVNLMCDGYVPPLMHAIEYGHLNMVIDLIGKGADIHYSYNGVDQQLQGQTPISYANRYHQDKIAEYLGSLK